MLKERAVADYAQAHIGSKLEKRGSPAETGKRRSLFPTKTRYRPSHRL